MFESEGTTDARFVRATLEGELHTRLGSVSRKVVRADPRRKEVKPKVCGGCQSGVMVGPYEVDGLTIYRCSRKCGYSKVIL